MKPRSRVKRHFTRDKLRAPYRKYSHGKDFTNARHQISLCPILDSGQILSKQNEIGKAEQSGMRTTNYCIAESQSNDTNLSKNPRKEFCYDYHARNAIYKVRTYQNKHY